MRSSLRVERLPVAAARHGRVLAAGVFTHPERGLVECAAAWLLASGQNGLLRPGEMPELCRPGEGDGVMFAVSWLERSGTVAGFALVAHREDRAGLEAAERDVAAWTTVVRSRRLLVAATGGLCPGGRRAARVIGQAAGHADAPVFVLGRPVADETTLMQMRRSEIRFAASLDEVPDDGVVVYPAHGAGLQAQAEAAARALAVVDGTCPLVAAAQADAFRNAERGDVVVVVGRAGHAVVPSLAGHAGPVAVVVGNPAEAARFPLPAGCDGRRVSFVVDPAMPADQAMPVVAALRARFPELRGHNFDVLCDVASDWTQTVAAVAAGCELMLVLTAAADGDEPEAVRASCPDVPVCAVTAVADLDRQVLGQATVIGLITGLSAPAGLLSQVISALSGLGPLSVRHRGTRTWPDTGVWSQGGSPGQDLFHSAVGGVRKEP